MPTKESKRYEYTPLREVAEFNQNSTVNVYGVVLSATEPAQSRGGDKDHYTTLFLCDPSLGAAAAAAGDGIEVRCFSQSPHGVPRVQSTFDIARVHRGRVVHYRPGKPQIVASIKQRSGTPFSSWLLFSHDESAGTEPYQSPTPSYTIEHENEKELRQLRYLRQFARNCMPAEPSTEQCCLSQIKPSSARVDVLCTIATSTERFPPGCITLWVWDATDAPVPTDAWSASDFPYLEFPFHSAGATFCDTDTFGGLGPHIPSLGSIIPVIIDESHDCIAEVPPIGTTIRVREAYPYAARRQLQLVLYEKSTIDHVDDNTTIPNRYHSRVDLCQTVQTDAEDPDGSTGLIVRTKTFHDSVAPSTLRQLKAHQPPYKARVLARIRQWFPEDLRFCVSTSGANSDGDQSDLEIRLGVELEVRISCRSSLLLFIRRAKQLSLLANDEPV